MSREEEDIEEESSTASINQKSEKFDEEEEAEKDVHFSSIATQTKSDDRCNSICGGLEAEGSAGEVLG